MKFEEELRLADTLAIMTVKAMDKTGEDVPNRELYGTMATTLVQQVGYQKDVEAIRRIATLAEVLVTYFMSGFDLGKRRATCG